MPSDSGVTPHSRCAFGRPSDRERERDRSGGAAPAPAWRAYRNLLALAQLRSERVPLPDKPGFELEEQALDTASEMEHLVVGRIVEARRELAGVPPTPDAAHRHRPRGARPGGPQNLSVEEGSRSDASKLGPTGFGLDGR